MKVHRTIRKLAGTEGPQLIFHAADVKAEAVLRVSDPINI